MHFPKVDEIESSILYFGLSPLVSVPVLEKPGLERAPKHVVDVKSQVLSELYKI